MDQYHNNTAAKSGQPLKSLDQQVGGAHYKHFTIQPLEFCLKNRLDMCQSNIIKYVCRFRAKNGAEDLLKARHYIDLLLELEYPNG